MIKLIIRQTNWGIFGSLFAFAIGFFVKIYLLDIVGLDAWGRYVTAQTFVSFIETVLALGIPFVIIKFIPTLIDKHKEKASRISSVFLKYALVIGGGFLVMNYFLSPYIDKFIYTKVDSLSFILFLMSIHVPISLLFGVIISLYRSMLKIKEIVLYGTVVSVLVRAVLTVVVFQFTSNITYFIIIEVFAQILVLFILLFLFNRNQFPIFVKSETKDVIGDNVMIAYGSKMFLNSIIAFISGQSLKFIISIKLLSVDVGAYSILLTLTGLTTFLLINLNKVIAPVITKLYDEGKVTELNEVYKKTTFLVNIFTIPLAVLIMFFADEILGLYTEEMISYKPYLFFMMIGGVMSLVTGSSGMVMVMAGLERHDVNIQFIRAVLLIFLSLWLIPLMGLKIVVILYVLSVFFEKVFQLFYINKYVSISPFSKDLIFLLLLTIIAMFFAVTQQFDFEIYHYFIIPIGIYLIYFSIMYYPLKKLIKELF
jgi:O-antigen/teichoic acid export membrane protein